jgi:AraC family transcriptional regulator
VTVANTLSTSTLHWARLGQARRFIRDHAEEALTLERIAAAAATSPYHFARIFRALTGETVFTHVSRVRLRKAAALLLDEPGLTVTRVAAAVGHETPSSFDKLFKRVLGVTPTEFRARSASVRATLVRRLDDPDTTPAEGLDLSREPLFQDRPPRRFLFVRRRGLCPEEAPAAWAEFHRVAGGLRVDGGEHVGASYDDTGPIRETMHRYEAGIAVPEGTPVPRGLAAGRLPGGPYAVFRYRGSYAHIGRAFDALFRGWVVDSGVTLSPAPCLEIYLDGAGRVSERERRTDLCLPVSERP